MAMAFIHRFSDPLEDDEGRAYRVEAHGHLAETGLWEGWLEFVPVGGGDPVVGPVESRQPEREHLIYWATGLSPVSLEGALRQLSTTMRRGKFRSELEGLEDQLQQGIALRDALVAGLTFGIPNLPAQS